MSTKTLIQTITVGVGGAASIDFTSIPATYNDLVLVASLRSDRSGAGYDSLLVKFNGSTASYTYRNLYGNGATVASVSGSSNQASYSVDAPLATANVFNSCSLYIPNYLSANYKSMSIDSVSEDNSSNYGLTEIRAFLWSNTAAINQVTLLPETGPNFVQYSMATLYGIRNS